MTAAEQAEARAGVILEEVRKIYEKIVTVPTSSPAASTDKTELQILQAVIDTKILTKIDVFKGEDDKWGEWCFVFENTCALLDLDGLMEVACSTDQVNVLQMSNYNPKVRLQAKALYHLLIQVVRNKALTVIRLVEKYNGFLAWRHLKHEYEASVGARFTAMLCSILTPGWRPDIGFDQQLMNWERFIHEYTTQSKESISDNTKLAVLTKHAPEEIKRVVRQHASCKVYNEMRKHIFDFLAAGREYTTAGAAMPDGGGGVPMDVGAINKDRGWKGGKGDSKKGSYKFEGNCSRCGYYGHKKVDCKTDLSKLPLASC